MRSNYREEIKISLQEEEEEEEEEEGRLKTSIHVVDVTLEFIATCIYSDVDPRHHRSTRRVSFLAAQNPSTNIRKFHVYDANAHIFSRSCRQIYLAKYLENSAPTGSG